jgi:hypothetical protein
MAAFLYWRDSMTVSQFGPDPTFVAAQRLVRSRGEPDIGRPGPLQPLLTRSRLRAAESPSAGCGGLSQRSCRSFL